MMGRNCVRAAHNIAEQHLQRDGTSSVTAQIETLPTILGFLLSANDADVRSVLMAAFVLLGCFWQPVD